MQASARRSRQPQVALCLAVASLVCCAPLAVFAADAAATTTSSDTTTADTGSLPEITVTATRREQSLSRVPISITAFTAADMEVKGIKDISDIARFTPGVSIDTSGTNNISIRGISSSGGAGTTGIYLDDTPIQMRALSLNPDEALPKTFDIDRVEILRGPQGTLFGAGSEGGTVRYITVQPSLTKDSVDGTAEVDFTQGGAPSYEAGAAAGGPLIDGKLGARVTVWYRRDGGWIDTTDATTIDPTVTQKNANYRSTYLARLAAIWAVNDTWTATPSVYFQKKDQHNGDAFWVDSSDPASNSYKNGDPTLRGLPDTFYLPALKIEGDFGAFHLISNTSFYHRQEQTGYEGSEYNLGFYQLYLPGAADVNGATITPLVPLPLLDGTGVHLPASIANYTSPASIDNHQQNIVQEVRLVSSDPGARLEWTTGVFFSLNRQSYLEQIHDPMLNAFTQAVFGESYANLFPYSPDPNDPDPTYFPTPYDPAYPTDSYFLNTHATDKQYAWYGEGTWSFNDVLKATVGLRESHMSYSLNTLTGGPQLYNPTIQQSVGSSENAFTPKANLTWQITPHDMAYATYAKGFRPGGGNNPLPAIACAPDFATFGISSSPATYNSDHVDSFEVGAKDNIDNRLKIATSLYYIIWHNIQQTVLPPVCQITFITNLGEAVAKGGDIQIEWAATDSLSAELAAGYTDARYTKDASFPGVASPADGGPLPIAVAGDAITGQSGQPNAPYSVSVGLEYHVTLAQHDSFVRVDWEYEASSKWQSPQEDTNTAQGDPDNFSLSSTSFVSLRAGVQLGDLSIEPFIDNLTDSRALTNYDWSINDGVDSRLLRGWGFRPRTFGVTFTYKH